MKTEYLIIGIVILFFLPLAFAKEKTGTISQIGKVARYSDFLKWYKENVHIYNSDGSIPGENDRFVYWYENIFKGIK